METIENLDKVRRVIVWDRRQIGWIEHREVGFFRKKDRIYFFALVAGFWDQVFKSERKLQSFLTENNLSIEDDTVFEEWSVDLIYSYKCSQTIYFKTKTARNDWLSEHFNSGIYIKNNEVQ